MPVLMEFLEVALLGYLAWKVRAEVRRIDFSDAQVRAVHAFGPGYDAIVAADWLRALAYFHPLLENDGCPSAHRDVALWLRARAFMGMGDPLRALADANAALALNLQLSGAYLVRAHAHEALGDLRRAEENADYAIRLQEQNPDLYRLRARLREASGQPARAAQDLAHAAALAQANR